MFSTIHEAWGSNFQETREAFQQPSIARQIQTPSHKMPYVEHFCPSCRSKLQRPPSVNMPCINDHILNATLFGLLVLVILQLMEK